MERRLERDIADFGGEAVRVERRGRRGWLDYEVFVPWIETQYVELKNPDDPYAKLTPQQQHTVKFLQRMNKSVWLLHSWKDYDYFITWLMAQRR